MYSPLSYKGKDSRSRSSDVLVCCRALKIGLGNYYLNAELEEPWNFEVGKSSQILISLGIKKHQLLRLISSNMRTGDSPFISSISDALTISGSVFLPILNVRARFSALVEHGPLWIYYLSLYYNFVVAISLDFGRPF
ncbi:hypothetical protein GYMLUDRAFT_603812 [Collybiopsis luxurians FD-317 M1]|uniref:Uncharacterized protein n=1 Tax=Collybiopsis luxurians FD-317 M1 TaxID=944289 RepID=A0A0D0CCU9_9AGAR|nr:hypothetical protein GYMLUDRAFT_603812 [Collybiopsis luxurians FD-317 M1]